MSTLCLWKSYDFYGDAFDIFTLFKDEPYVFFLDSSLTHPQQGRYSFIGFDPFFVYRCKGKNALEDLRSLHQQYQMHFCGVPSPLCAGMVGFFGYDFGLQLERIRLLGRDEGELPDCLFGLYDCIITVDHLRHQLYLTSTGIPERNHRLRQIRASERLDKIQKKLDYDRPSTIINISAMNDFYDEEEMVKMISCNFTKEQYLNSVQKALDYIRAGDIYQVNLSQRFQLDTRILSEIIDPLQMYATLRRISPSYFGGYFDGGDFQILSSSPERFLRLKDGRVQTRPMKGTRARGRNVEEDERLKKDLLNSSKDKAELLMITDLQRNDLGRVCRYGSVKVKQRRILEEYATVYQTTSLIEGVLQEKKDAFDLIAACFPGGSITGCPKIRAMDIIEELETCRRGIYTGSLGYIDFSGHMDFNILIRTLLMKNKDIYFHVGGGIISDSIPEWEYQETMIKAQGMLKALAHLWQAKAEV